MNPYTIVASNANLCWPQCKSCRKELQALAAQYDGSWQPEKEDQFAFVFRNGVIAGAYAMLSPIALAARISRARRNRLPCGRQRNAGSAFSFQYERYSYGV